MAQNVPIVDVDLNKCLIRFQKPQGGASGKVEVKDLNNGKPSATPEGVASTINNFTNSNHTNMALWLMGDTWSMRYAGVVLAPPEKGILVPESQPGLDGDDVVVSIILPTGMDKLDVIKTSGNDLPGQHKEVNNHLFGISIHSGHQLTEADFAYTDSKTLKQTINDLRVPLLVDSKARGGFTVNSHGIVYKFLIEKPW